MNVPAFTFNVSVSPLSKNANCAVPPGCADCVSTSAPDTPVKLIADALLYVIVADPKAAESVAVVAPTVTASAPEVPMMFSELVPVLPLKVSPPETSGSPVEKSTVNESFADVPANVNVLMFDNVYTVAVPVAVLLFQTLTLVPSPRM